MVSNGFTWAFEESNPKYAKMKRQRMLSAKKADQEIMLVVWMDGGKVTIDHQPAGSIPALIHKHEKMISCTRYNK